MNFLIFFLIGLVIGSFLNVCIYRIPRGKSIIKPFSFCPKCGSTIKPWHNIPFISYIFLKGKCAYCGEKISIKYPVVELLNGFLYILAYSYFGLTPAFFFSLIFISALIVVSFIDIEFQIIPDVISIPLIALGVVFTVFFHDGSEMLSGLWRSLTGILVGGGCLLLVSILSKGGMGGGDIKLNAAVGAWIGWKASLLTIFIGSLAGSIIGLIILKKTGNRKIAFGPFLALGALVSLFWGEKIINFYFG